MQERRMYPRFTYTQTVELRGPNGIQFDVESCDISVAGLGMFMGHHIVVALAQGGSILTPGDRLQVLLPGTLNPSLEGGLTLECQVRHVRRLSREQYQVGVRFLGPTPGQTAGLEALVQSAKKVPFR